ncbi:MAG TPA: hypothetical protein VK424_04135 [Thermoplasmata archaeon]|nr:hypothetical protein [Thermoplasmata archaeon]
MVDFENVALWTTVATWVLAVGTLVVLYWQTRQAGQLHSSNAVIELRDRFDLPRMRRLRRQTSERLLRNEEADIANLEVPIFFELIGAQTKRKILDEEMVWEAFGGWITSYYHAMRKPVDRIRLLREAAHDPLLFGKFEWLNDRIVALDRKALGDEYSSSVAAFEDSGLLLRRESLLDPE